eukprot:TRINITY_DN4426_c0_g1_i2.p1 TRINITY_DN4426_c0_g1~~TRINITY_DN4426_c0_g1_i2.p1  ORF type:complete len:458 (+),score=150.74 TRINITY_DN4426_c0_g1_i2:158-1531(+)
MAAGRHADGREPHETTLQVEHAANSDESKRQWREIKSTGPIPLGRIGHSICDDGAGNLYLWGGVNEGIEGKYLSDFFRYAFHRKEWTEIPLVAADPDANNSKGPITPRAFHSAVCYEGHVVIFGGCNGKGRFHEINTINTAGPGMGECRTTMPDEGEGTVSPPSRYCHTSVVYKTKMLVFGGKNGGRNSNKRLDDMYAYDFVTSTWSEVKAKGTPPSSRSAHTSVVYGKKMLVFGGRDSDGVCCEDFHEFHLEANVWRKLEKNHPLLMRARHSAVVHNDSIIIFGGWDGRKKRNDLCVYNLDNNKITVVHDNEESNAHLPCRRECHTTVVVDNNLYLFGGRFRGLFMNDSFEYPLPPPSLKFLLRQWFVDKDISLPPCIPPIVSSNIDDYKRRFVDPPVVDPATGCVHAPRLRELAATKGATSSTGTQASIYQQPASWQDWPTQQLPTQASHAGGKK